MKGLLAALSLLAAGCAVAGGAPAGTDGGADAGAEPSGPWLVVGTGSDHFVALTDGDQVTLIHGPQGGYHIWGAFRAGNLAAGELDLRYSVTLDGSAPEVLSSSTYHVTPLPDGDALTWAGLIGFVPDPTKAIGQTVTLSMTATDAEGQTATDEKTVVVLPPEN